MTYSDHQRMSSQFYIAAWNLYRAYGIAVFPPKNPVGIFKALIVKRAQQIPGERELHIRLWLTLI
jgi:hypothetical protein